MKVKCVKCINCINDPITAGSGDQFCKAGLWDREDEFMIQDEVFKKHINKDRFCSGFKGSTS